MLQNPHYWQFCHFRAIFMLVLNRYHSATLVGYKTMAR
jgi:hypothetical protein